MFGLIERYFFKRRNIMLYPAEDFPHHCVEAKPMAKIERDFADRFDDPTLKKLIINRASDPSWVLFLYIESGELQGYGFLHAPEKEEWNDSLPTRQTEARIGSQFVFPAFRGRNVRGKIFKAQSSYAAENGKHLWSVIERSNVSSMRSALKTGRVQRKNHLVKIMGENVASILTNPFEVFFLYGERRARR